MKCCFCKADAGKYGHNAMPLKDGRCCGRCNCTKVIPERIKRLQLQIKKSKGDDKSNG